MAKQKTRKIKLTQENGIISAHINDELEYTFDANFIIERVTEGHMDSIGLANIIAELIHDCLNCRTASASLHDANDTKSYRGTYFEWFDWHTKNGD